MDSVAKYCNYINFFLIFLVIIFFSVMGFVILKYHVNDIGTYSEFMIMLANLVIAISAVFGVYEARRWLVKRKSEEVFNKEQKIRFNIMCFAMKSKQLTLTLSELKANINDVSYSGGSNHADVVAFLLKSASEVERCWDEARLESEMIELVSVEGDDNLREYIHSIECSASRMVEGYGFLVALLSRFLLEDNKELIKKEIYNVCLIILSCNEIIQKSHQEYKDSMCKS